MGHQTHEEVERRSNNNNNNNTSIVVSNKKMKFFLLDFVSCYRPSKNPAIQPSQDQAEDMLRDITKQLSCAVGDGDDSNPTHSKKRGKKKAVTRSNSISSSLAQWKPSLSAISEDKVVFVMAKKSSERKTVRSDGKAVAGKTGSRAKIRSRDDRRDNEYRRNSSPVVIPSFSPTAFLF